MYYSIGGHYRYGVSEDGIIVNLETGKILKLTPDKDGYLCFISCINYVKKCLKVHRVVAEVFIPNPNNYPQVNHKNFNKQDNRKGNLEWCTDQYNKQHLWTTCPIKPRTPRKHGADSDKAKAVLQFSLDGLKIGEWGSVIDAINDTGIVNISACCKGKLRTAGGYRWSYRQ
jgi:hypothetical protein